MPIDEDVIDGEYDESESANKSLSIKELVKKLKGACINGKDSKLLDESEKLNEFIMGPCMPVIIVPGIMGTSLNAEIDCKVLRENHPDIFKNCGWNNCEKELWPVWKKPPQDFSVWVGDLFSANTIVEFSKK